MLLIHHSVYDIYSDLLFIVATRAAAENELALIRRWITNLLRVVVFRFHQFLTIN